ncbi:MAG: hypothetical protein ABIL68_05050 [bacterium]
MRCYRCGIDIETKEKIGRQQTCPKCGVYVHCCFNCKFYDETTYHQCRETEAEWVSDKRSANFCDYFEPGESKTSPLSSRAEEARRKLDDLFKK